MINGQLPLRAEEQVGPEGQEEQRVENLRQLMANDNINDAVRNDNETDGSQVELADYRENWDQGVQGSAPI